MECVIDNVVNRVLESYRSILSVFDELESNLENAAENAAIQSAIDAHGVHLSSPSEDDSSLSFDTSAEDPDPDQFDFTEVAISRAICSKGLSTSANLDRTSSET